MPETKYTVWIGSEHPWGRTYLAELQTLQLKDDQLNWIGDEVIDKLNDWEGEDNLRQDLEDGCCGWGPYTDQYLGVCITGEEEQPLCTLDIEKLIDEDRAEVDHVMSASVKGKHLIGCHIEKGGYQGELTLPANETFDPDKLKVNVVSLVDTFTIVNGVTYGDIDIEMEGDTTGKGSDYYFYKNEELKIIG